MTRGPAKKGTYFPGSARKPINHGTIGCHRAHYRHGEPMCDACRDANRRSRGSKPFEPAKCGTHSGYNSHRLRGEEACAECRAAAAAYQRERSRARRAAS